LEYTQNKDAYTAIYLIFKNIFSILITFTGINSQSAYLSTIEAQTTINKQKLKLEAQLYCYFTVIYIHHLNCILSDIYRF